MGDSADIALSLGSNLGDRLAHLSAARDRIAALPGVVVVGQAPVYETEPVGVKPEYAHLKYLNTALIVRTDRPLPDLHRDLAQIETDLGRVRGADRFAPRTIDIDLLYADDQVHRTDQLTLPHPRWAERRFVLQPLCDLCPDHVVPGTTRPLRDHLAALPPGEALAVYAKVW